MAIIQLSPVINHFNFIHSYLIRTEDVLASEIRIQVEKEDTIARIGKLNFKCLNFPKDCIPYYNTVKEEGDIVINILAIPKELTQWCEKGKKDKK